MTREEFLAEVQPIPQDPPYPPDWQVTSVERLDYVTYRFRVTGINHNHPVGDPFRNFVWAIPSLNWRFFWPNREAS